MARLREDVRKISPHKDIRAFIDIWYNILPLQPLLVDALAMGHKNYWANSAFGNVVKLGCLLHKKLFFYIMASCLVSFGLKMH